MYAFILHVFVLRVCAVHGVCSLECTILCMGVCVRVCVCVCVCTYDMDLQCT